MSGLLKALNGELAGAVSAARRSLLQVRRRDSRGGGAGTVWHADGLVITNAHVVLGSGRGRRQADGLEVVLPDGEVLPADVLALDTRRDLAALTWGRPARFRTAGI